MAKRAKNKIRIIGGEWRGHHINIPDVAGLRPTTDRIRETVFNWLQQAIIDATCLDLFSGSGGLGFEAASRGARSIDMIDKSDIVIKHLWIMKEKLNANNINIYNQDAIKKLKSTPNQYDIIFIDPPFHQNLITTCIQLIYKNQILKRNGLLYIEMESNHEIPNLPENWSFKHKKTAGQVEYCLITTH